MTNKKVMPESLLQIDLTSLYYPSMAEALHKPQDLQKGFEFVQKRIAKMNEAGLLGFSDLPFDQEMLESILQAKERYKNVKNIVVFGIGGSALGAQSIWYALNGAFANLQTEREDPRFFVIDHIEPLALQELQEQLDAKDTLFIIISKSGNTSETLAQYRFLCEHFKNLSLENLFIITDQDKGFLKKQAEEEGIATLPVPKNVGGRFSVLSPVGLFPLAVAGVDIERLLQGARTMEEFCRKNSLSDNPAALMALTWNYWLQEKKFSQVVMMPYSDRLRFFSDWFAQLFGESLGKVKEDGHVGFTPIKALGVTDQHSQLQLYLEGPRDKIICFVDVTNYKNEGSLGQKQFGDDRIDFLAGSSMAKLMHAEKQATQKSLSENSRPNQTITLSGLDEFQLGQLYQLFMHVVPFLGALLEINPFDQPAVERIKNLTFALMGRKGFEDLV